jgi:hypothetical protein
MDMVEMKMLVSILKESQLYMTMTHEERIALLFRLLKEYPFLDKSQDSPISEEMVRALFSQEPR